MAISRTYNIHIENTIFEGTIAVAQMYGSNGMSNGVALEITNGPMPQQGNAKMLHLSLTEAAELHAALALFINRATPADEQRLQGVPVEIDNSPF